MRCRQEGDRAALLLAEDVVDDDTAAGWPPIVPPSVPSMLPVATFSVVWPERDTRAQSRRTRGRGGGGDRRQCEKRNHPSHVSSFE